MRKIVVTEFITLDGVIEDPGGSEHHERGGWAFQFERGPIGDQFKLDEVMASDALLLGRKTYQGFADSWPGREGEFADLMNNMQKYVVSNTLKNPSWNNTRLIKGNIAEEVAKLKEMPGRDILVYGSAQLTNTLMRHDLVDQYNLMVFPVVLGSGKRLFQNEADRHPLRLIDEKPVGDGVLIIIYQPIREHSL